MKRLVIPLSILGFVIFAISCDTVEEEPNYTYEIDSVWWSDAIDGNSDSFLQFERLNFNVHLKEDVSPKIKGRVYYKLKEASNFSFYAFSEEKKVLGNNVDNLFFVSIGSPNKELQRGIYDFKIEILQNNQQDIKAETDSAQLLILSNKQFELSENDNNYTLNISWINKVDKNGNGFLRSASLVIDANNDENITRNLDVKVYYKKSNNTDFIFYDEKNNFEISGNSDTDTITIPIGTTNKELEKAEYDFRVDLFEAGKKNLLAFEDMENPLLSKQKFETEDDDSYYYKISNIWWSDSTDLDNDSYTSIRKLHYDIDVDKNEKRTLFAKVYFRVHEENPTDSSNYDILYDSTANFTITGSKNTDAYFSLIGKNHTVELDSNKYDILISVYDALKTDTTQSAVISLSGFTEPILNEQPFETISQDSL